MHALTVAVGKLGGRLQRWATPAESRQTEEERLALHCRRRRDWLQRVGHCRAKRCCSAVKKSRPARCWPDMGWSTIVREASSVEVMPGDHHQIFNLPGAAA